MSRRHEFEHRARHRFYTRLNRDRLKASAIVGWVTAGWLTLALAWHEVEVVGVGYTICLIVWGLVHLRLWGKRERPLEHLDGPMFPGEPICSCGQYPNDRPLYGEEADDDRQRVRVP